MRRALTLAAALTCAAALTACGTIHDTIQPTASHADRLIVDLAGTPDAGQVGLLAASADGEMSRAGIALTLRAPGSASQPLSDLQAKRVDVAVIPEPQLMIARADGDYVLGFGALTQTTTDAFVSLRSRHIRSIADLKGKAIGIDGLSYERRLLGVILAQAHVPASSVRVVDVGADPASALTSKQVAATFGAGEATVAALRSAHHGVAEMSVRSLGVPTYQDLVFVTREKYYADNVNLMRRFVQAVGRGYAAIRSDPARGVALLRATDPSLSAAAASTAVSSAVASAFPGDGHPWGWMSQRLWNVFGRWMTAHNLLDGSPAWYQASTNNMLAGQGP